MSLTEKKRLLERIIRNAGSALVAFSGGADSTYLTFVTHRVLGERMLAVTSRSAVHPAREAAEASAFAAARGIPHLAVEGGELESPRFRENAPDRCYHCKLAILTKLKRIAAERGLAEVFEGTNTDDFSDFRPGRRAIAEAGARSPLAEAGLSKAEIRMLSKEAGLPTWDLPASACLASRFPYNTPIEVGKLAMVEKAEVGVRQLGFRLIRVRCHGDLARLEIDPAELPLALYPALITKLADVIKEAGFTYAALDLEGYRMGSMNEALSDSVP